MFALKKNEYSSARAYSGYATNGQTHCKSDKERKPVEMKLEGGKPEQEIVMVRHGECSALVGSVSCNDDNRRCDCGISGFTGEFRCMDRYCPRFIKYAAMNIDANIAGYRVVVH